MGQEASVPRNFPDEASTFQQQQQPPPPLPVCVTEQPGNNVADAHVHVDGAHQNATDGNSSAWNPATNNASPPRSVMHVERPQSQQQLRQQPPHPPPHHPIAAQATRGKTQINSTRFDQQQHQGSSTPASTSIMSRAGLSSMIQRIGVVGSAGSRSVPNSPSRYGSRNSGSSHGGVVKQHTVQSQQQLQFQAQQRQEHNMTSTSNTYNNSVHHQELSPDSKARQQASMMRKQQQEQHRSKQQKNPRIAVVTQQSSSSANGAINDDNESSKTIVNMMYTGGHDSNSTSSVRTNAVPNQNVSGANNDSDNSESAIGTTPTTSLVQGMNNLHLSPRSQPRSPTQQSNNKSPPSPRAISLRQMQHNDEEDWEKAWAEDSEDSDEEDEGGVDADSSNKITTTTAATVAAAAAITGVEQDVGMLPIVPDLSVGDTKIKVEGEEITVQLRPPDVVDSGDSSMPFAQDIVAPPSLAMQSAFTPTKPQHPIDNRQQRDDQRNGLVLAMTKPPSIQLPILPNEKMDEERRLTLEADEALQQGGESGQQFSWDSGDREGVLVEEEDERPCVKMFDPALRVLGRGSFGRVSDTYEYYCTTR